MVSSSGSDLARDRDDLLGSIAAAEERAAAADELLVQLGDPGAGVVRSRRRLTQLLEAARKRYPQGTMSADEAAVMLTRMRRFDVADAAFGEATASGRFDVIQDAELRAMIAGYYFDADRFRAGDERAEANADHFRNVLAGAGLALTDASAILAVFRDQPALIAELKNYRESALLQINSNSTVLAAGDSVAASLDEWFAGR